MSRVVVIGAGISGLASAALLAQDGHEVTLLEREDAVGGRAGRIEDSGFVFDTGPSWYLMPEVFDAFFRRFDTTAAQQLDLVDLDPSYRLYPGHGAPSTAAAGGAGTSDDVTAEPLDVRSDRAELHALFEAREPGSAAVLDAHLGEASALYDLASRHALRTDFAREHRGVAGLPARLRQLRDMARMLVAESTRSAGLRRLLLRLPHLLSGSLQDLVHSRFRDPLLRQILLYPSVFLATDPARAPALYHLMSRMDLVDGVRYPVGGMHSLVEAFAALARSAGADIVTGAEVVALSPGHKRPCGTHGRHPSGPPAGRSGPTAQKGADHERRRCPAIAEVVARIRTEPRPGARTRLEVIEPDWVVAACDLHHLETRLLPPALRSVPARRWSRRDPGMGALVVMLGVEGRIPGLAHHSLFFTADWEENFTSVFGGRAAALPEPGSVYVCAASATDDSVAPAGCENLFVLVPAPANPSLRAGQRGVEEYVDRVIDAVGERVGAADLRARVRVRHVRAPGDFSDSFHAWSGTALGPAHTLGQSAMFRDSVVSPRADNLLRAGAFTAPGVGLPMCVMSAENAVDALRVLDGAGGDGPACDPGNEAVRASGGWRGAHP